MTSAPFWTHVAIGAPDECWPWLLGTDDHGYGRFTPLGQSETKAHRFAWADANGPVPAGANILHSCDNRPCCNPDHLRPGSARDNAQDCLSRGRWPRMIGIRNGKAKLTDDQVAAIRADGRKGRIIAADYGVSQALVSMIRREQRRPASQVQSLSRPPYSLDNSITCEFVPNRNELPWRGIGAL